MVSSERASSTRPSLASNSPRTLGSRWEPRRAPFAASSSTMRSAFAGQLVGRGFRPIPEIRKARLGNKAGLIGAADLSRR